MSEQAYSGLPSSAKRPTVCEDLVGGLRAACVIGVVVLALVVPTVVGASCPVVHRSMAVRRAFKKATGFPHGRPGYVVDHVEPLCAGGKDAIENMAWSAIVDAKIKDKWERQYCHSLWYKH